MRRKRHALQWDHLPRSRAAAFEKAEKTRVGRKILKGSSSLQKLRGKLAKQEPIAASDFQKGGGMTSHTVILKMGGR